MIKPCVYCKLNNNCEKQKDIRRINKEYDFKFVKMYCGLFVDRLVKGQRVKVKNLYVGKFEDISFCPITGSEHDFTNRLILSSELLATVKGRSKTKPTKILITLDEELSEDSVGENCEDRLNFATKESNLEII